MWETNQLKVTRKNTNKKRQNKKPTNEIILRYPIKWKEEEENGRICNKNGC